MIKRSIIIALAILSVSACKLSNTNPGEEDNKELSTVFNNYYEERLRLFPLEATAIGDKRYNNLLPVDFTDGYRDSLKQFYNRYLTYVSKFNRENLNDKDKISYDVFKREMEINLRRFEFY
ncbi:MAG: hypothetical protein WKG06_43940 [Segetibacter sp.]